MFDKPYFHPGVLAPTATQAAKWCMKRKRRRIDYNAGNFIGAWREYRGITQDQLAELANSSIATISRLEAGKVGYTNTTLENIALALQVEPWQLLGQRPDAAPDLFQKLQSASPEQLRQVEAVADALLQFTPFPRPPNP